ncbi:MAG TPA: phosphoribosylglycinamide formyltransferase [Gemmatimonadaceae bacterium]|nr:phosphoribosylglycinamide formyltransferase [Gemmatimonadaceae bacterium]
MRLTDVTARIAVLASGGGTNLQAILDHFAALGPGAPGRVVVVASDRAQAGALDRARRAGLAAVHLAPNTRDQDLERLLEQYRIDLIALAGYLRLVPPSVTRAYAERIVNVHPALLPAFGGQGMYGRHVHEAVLSSGAKESGATVHIVNEVFDSGRILAQERVPVMPQDTPDTLAARVLAVEHRLYPRVIEELCRRVGTK